LLQTKPTPVSVDAQPSRREPLDLDELRRTLLVVAEYLVAALTPAPPEPPKPIILPDAPPPEYVTSREIAARINVNKTTLYRWVEAGKFPRPAIRLGTQQPRWRMSDYLAWEEARKTESDKPC